MTKIDRTIADWTEVACKTGLTWNRLLEMEAAGTFPPRVPGEHSQVWKREDVENWIRTRTIDSDPMPTDDPEALVAWGKRHIQG